MKRLIEVKFKNLNDLEKIYNLEFKYIKEITKKRIIFYYTKSNSNKLILYGYDGKIKYKINKFDDISFNNIIKFINLMPMSKFDNGKFDINYKCGLGKLNNTSHCFKDNTHQTCCMLGYKTRRYADKSGNPIGKESEKAFENYFGFTPNKKTLIPWCTCIGSQVCTYYSNKFNDGTHIKFINNKGENIIYNINTCEKKIAEDLNYLKHKTPGIKNIKNSNCLDNLKYHNI
jgi:hypothetical protein